MAGTEIIARRRKWTAEQKAALLAEVEAEGGRVAMVAAAWSIGEPPLQLARGVEGDGISG